MFWYSPMWHSTGQDQFPLVQECYVDPFVSTKKTRKNENENFSCVDSIQVVR
jgi:hypothetical protein